MKFDLTWKYGRYADASCFYLMSQSKHSRVIQPQSQLIVIGDAKLLFLQAFNKIFLFFLLGLVNPTTMLLIVDFNLVLHIHVLVPIIRTKRGRHIRVQCIQNS